MCLCGCLHVVRVFRGSQKVVLKPLSGVTGGWELLGKKWELNSDPLKEQSSEYSELLSHPSSLFICLFTFCV